jgi:tRNA(Leu) C34 or U34 (ribose-2'-O)-methylase TrmL
MAQRRAHVWHMSPAAREAHFTYGQRLVKVRPRTPSPSTPGPSPPAPPSFSLHRLCEPLHVSRGRLSRSRTFKVMSPPLHLPIDESPETVRAALAPLRHDFSVGLWTPGNAFAVGAIIRVAHNFLAREIFLVGGESHYPKASMGMHKYETIVRTADGEELLGLLGRRPVWAVEKDHARRSIHAVERFPPGVVFLFGSERHGLPEAILKRADEVVGIPIYGVNQSLPLAVAAGIVMSEWTRRRYTDGAVV